MMLIGCGDPLASGEYPGDPLGLFGGEFSEVQLEPFTPLPELAVTVVWAGQTEHHPVEVGVTYPWSHSITLYNPPTAGFIELREGPLAVGLVVAFLDEDGDGLLTTGEELVGLAGGRNIFYAPYPVELPVLAELEMDEGAVFNGGGFFLGDATECSPDGQLMLKARRSFETHISVNGTLDMLPDLDCDMDPLEDSEFGCICEGDGCPR